MSEVSTFRLYLLRAMYVFVAVGLAIFKYGRPYYIPRTSRPRTA